MFRIGEPGIPRNHSGEIRIDLGIGGPPGAKSELRLRAETSEQFRFPRSKRRRIRKKWRKDPRNWRTTPLLETNPIYREMLDKVRAWQVRNICPPLDVAPFEGVVVGLPADLAAVEAKFIAGMFPASKVVCPTEDLHTKAAAELFQVTPDCVTPEMRRRGKMRNYNKHYGISAQELQDWVDKNA